MLVNKPFTASRRTCFVVCPFGNQDKSDEEIAIFNEIVELNDHVFRRTEALCAASELDVDLMDARGIDATGAVTIRDTVVGHIKDSDFVVVVMTADKPNAFIEFGWAKGLWRDPIILKRNEYKLPSDINDHLFIEYDRDKLSTDKDHVEKVAAELAEAILDRASMSPNTRPFGDDVFKPSQLAHGKVDVLGRFHNISSEEWSQQLWEAEQEIVLASSAVLKPIKQEFFDRSGKRIAINKLLFRRAIEGVKVTIIMQHPDNYSLEHMRQSEIAGETDSDWEEAVDSARADINRAFKIWSTERQSFDRIQKAGGTDIPLKPNGFRVIQMHDRFLPFRLSMTEKVAYYTLRFYTQLYNSGVCLVARPDPFNTDRYNPALFDQIKDEVSFLVEQNEERSESAYNTWAEAQNETQAR